jgi:uncharacterized protein (TIGR00251 family)
MADELFDVRDDGQVVLRVSVSPGAGRSVVVGRHGDALKVRVGAPPERGRANTAVVELLASVLGVPKADVELVGGETSRSKRVAVTGVDPDEVDRRLEAALDDLEASPGTDKVTRRRA